MSKRWVMIGRLLGLGLLAVLLLAACADLDEDDEADTDDPEESAENDDAAEDVDDDAAEDVDDDAAEDDADVPVADLVDTSVCDDVDGQGRTVGFGNLGESVPFAVLVREGIEAIADACDVEILNADNELDPSVALDNARTFATQDVDGVIQFQVDGDISDALCEELGDRPVIAIDIEHPECAVFMGADNRAAGEITGRGVGEWVEENWGCEVDQVVTFEGFASGQVSIDRLNGSIAGLEEVCPDNDYSDYEEWEPTYDEGNVTRMDADRTDPAFEQGQDWLTANPDAERIVALCLNEDSCTGFHAAVLAAGREGQVVFGSNGADPTAHDLIRDDEHYVGASGFFPERYGELVVPNLVRMMDGDEPESDPLLVEHVFIDGDNIDEYYQ